MKQKILFICVHNSARSVMAEAWINNLCGDHFQAHSAGLEPGDLNPLVMEAMQEIGIDVSQKKPEAVFDVYKRGIAFRFVIAVCDQAHGEKCPIYPGVTTRLDWSFSDPSEFTGSPQAKLEQVRLVRDQIKEKVQTWCAQICPTEETV